MTKRRPLALGAAAAIGFGSLFIAAPALAEDTASLPVTDQTEGQAPSLKDVERIAAQLEAEGVTLYGSVTSGGDQVLLTSEVEAGSKAEEAVEQAVDSEGVDRYLELAGPGTPLASTDVVGGAGYIGWRANPNDGGGTCSVGFSAWTGQGDPAIVTAGHCSLDGALSDVALSLPSAQPGAPGGGVGDDRLETHDLGTFGFNQFGGPGNTTGEEGDPSSIDIGIIDDINPELDLKPEVTDWSTAGEDDLSLRTTPVTSVGTVTEGDSVTHSGRTTGGGGGVSSEKTGDVLFEDGWLQVKGFRGDDDIRFVHGFGVEMAVDPGDSGGSIVRGETAVGVASAEATLTTGEEILWGSHLESALERVPGDYEIALHIDTPEVTSHTEGAELEPGETITGTAPSNATEVSLSTQPNSGESVPVEDGEWSMTAPSEPGDYTLSYSARNGFNSSESVEFNFSVLEGNVAAPVVTSPAPNSTVTAPVEAIEGTGIPGAELTMEGDVGSTVDVDSEGNWSVPTELEAGEYTIQLFQTVDGEDSRTITVSFTVEDEGSETAPVEVSSISDGDEFELADAPTSVSGTAEPGETVEVSIAAEDGGSGEAGVGTAAAANVGSTQAVEVGDDGSWTHALDYEPAVGTYTLTYGYEGETGDTLSFTIAETDDGNQPPNDDNDDSSDGGEDGNDGSGNEGDDQLPVTGFDSMSLLPYIGAAAAMVLIGAAVTLLAARRQQGGAADEG